MKKQIGVLENIMKNNDKTAQTNFSNSSPDYGTSSKLLTIATVVYNSRADIAETISSVINNKNKDIQYIVIDGGSSDGTLEILSQNAGAIDLIVSEPDGGIYDAMNKAIRYAEGKWILFLNSGDIWLQDKDDPTLQTLLNEVGHNVILCNTLVASQDKRPLYTKVPRLPLGQRSFLFSIPACHQGIIYRRASLPPFDTTFEIIADKTHLWALFHKNKGRDFAHFNKTVSEYRLGGFSEANRKKYHQEEARFFAATLSLGPAGYAAGIIFLTIKRWLFVLYQTLRSR